MASLFVFSFLLLKLSWDNARLATANDGAEKEREKKQTWKKKRTIEHMFTKFDGREKKYDDLEKTTTYRKRWKLARDRKKQNCMHKRSLVK